MAQNDNKDRFKNMSKQDTPAIRITDLCFCRGDRPILQDISLEVPQGALVAVMGPSGAGKTTLMHLITGQLTPEKGHVEVNGERVSAMNHKELYAYRRRIGVLLQSGALFTDLTVFENVAVPIREHTHLPECILRRLVLSKLEAVGLRGAAELMPSELSGGMARRVALARAIVLDPQLILYDEPMTGLDPISLGAVMRLVKELNQTLGLTSIVVTHKVEEMAHLVDYCYLLSDTQIVARGTPDQLMNNPSDSVQQFMNGLPDGPVPFHFPAPPLAAELLA